MQLAGRTVRELSDRMTVVYEDGTWLAAGACSWEYAGERAPS